MSLPEGYLIGYHPIDIPERPNVRLWCGYGGEVWLEDEKGNLERLEMIEPVGWQDETNETAAVIYFVLLVIIVGIIGWFGYELFSP